MLSLDRACLGLLDLCNEIPGPSIEEVFAYAPKYWLRVDDLYPSLLALLRLELVRPSEYVDRKSFMPAGVLVTPAGEQALRDRAHEVPRRRAHVSDLRTNKRDRSAVLGSFPRMSDLTPDVIGDLADAYLHAAMAADGATLSYQSEMFTSAARGFAHVQDARGFITAVRGCLDAHERKGKFLDLAIEARDLAALYPDCERAVLAAALVAIDEPYRDLLGTPVPQCELLDDLVACIQSISAAAMTLSQEYAISKMDPNALIGAVNRVEDIIGEAFKLQSRTLYGQAVQLLYHLIELAESIVSIKPGAAAFEARAGFAGRIGVARQGVLAIGGHRDLVCLPLPHSKVAFDHVIAAIRRVVRVALVPVWKSCRDHATNENTAAYWVIRLVEYSERRIREELNSEMQKLVPMHSMLPEGQATARVRTEAQVTDIASLRAQLSNAVRLLTAVRHDTLAIRYVTLPHLHEQLVAVLAIAFMNRDTLAQVCQHVSESSEMLAALDEMLGDELPAIRRDVEATITYVQTAAAIDDERRQLFLGELGKIVKLSSAGKIVTSVALIPGFLSCSFESSLALDWNKWLDKLRAAVSRQRTDH